MKLRKIYMPGEVIKDKEFGTGTIMLTFNTGVIVASIDFHHKRSLPLLCEVYLPKRNIWVTMKVKNEYTDIMWNFYKGKAHKADKKYQGNYTKMMKHERKKKTGGSGASRERKMTCTDYECAKNPLHDFRRCYN